MGKTLEVYLCRGPKKNPTFLQRKKSMLFLPLLLFLFVPEENWPELSNMFDLLFRWRQASKCKKLIKRLQCRLKFFSIRRSSIVKQAREDTSELLNNGDHQAAIFRAEEILKDQSLLEAYDILDTYCELITLYLPCIARRRKCPNNDIREAISTVMFAASWCGGDLPELQKIRKLFKGRYGNKFAKAADGSNPNGSPVNSLFRAKLCLKSVSDDATQILIDELAKDLQREVVSSKSIIQNAELDPEDESSHETIKRADCQKLIQRMISLESCSSNQISTSPLVLSKFEMGVDEIQSFFSYEDKNTVEKAVFFFNILPRRTQQGRIRPVDYSCCRDNDQFPCCCLEFPDCDCTTKGKEIAVYEQKLGDQEIDDGCGRSLQSGFAVEPRRGKSYCKHVHPKLPDYDEVVAKLVALKKEHQQRAAMTC